MMSGLRIAVFAMCVIIVSPKVFNFHVSKLDCIQIDKETANMSCAVQRLGNNSLQDIVNIDIYIFRPVNDMLVHLSVWKKLNGNFILTPVNITLNACRFSRKGERVPFHASLVLKWVSKYSNINYKCPYQGHLYIRNLKPGNFRLVIPDGEYRMDARIYEKTFATPLAIMRGFGTKS